MTEKDGDFDTDKCDTITWEELEAEWDAESKKKNLRNWLSDKIPGGIAEYDPLYALTHPWKIIRFCIRHIEWAWQRVFRGWDDRVIWSIDYYIAKMLPNWLDALKKTKHGIPSSMFKDEDNYFDENGVWCTKEEAWPIREKEWDDILDEIGKGFKLYAEDSWLKEDSEDGKQFEKSFDLFKKYFGGLWD